MDCGDTHLMTVMETEGRMTTMSSSPVLATASRLGHSLTITEQGMVNIPLPHTCTMNTASAAILRDEDKVGVLVLGLDKIIKDSL